MVEPWLLGAGAQTASDAFRRFQGGLEHLEWCASVADLKPRPLAAGGAAIAVISCRTHDMPRAVEEVTGRDTLDARERSRPKHDQS